MSRSTLLSTWILEALDVAGRRGSPLEVARRVWTEHEQDLRAHGDLLFTWQLDLHATAEAMANDGRLLVDESGDWRLPDGLVVPRPKPRSWSDDQITVAVTAYVDLLRAEHTGRPQRHDDAVAGVATEVGRSIDQVEAMFANIAHVVQERGITPLSGVGPRSNVPRGVRPAVEAALAD